MLMSINNQAVQNKGLLSSMHSSRGLMLLLDNFKRYRYLSLLLLLLFGLFLFCFVFFLFLFLFLFFLNKFIDGNKSYYSGKVSLSRKKMQQK